MDKKKQWDWIAEYDMSRKHLESLGLDYSEGYFMYGGDLYVIMNISDTLVQGRRFRRDYDAPVMRG